MIGAPDAAREVFLGLTTLQHRGQDAAGILTYDRQGFHSVKNTGLVENVFQRTHMDTLTGDWAVGHARYSTIGRGDLIDVQPFLLSHPYGLGMVHNGNIINSTELAQELKEQSLRQMLTRSDSEVLLHVFAEGLTAAGRSEAASGAANSAPLAFSVICSAVQNVFDRVNGSYSIVTLIAGEGLLAFRDPKGIRPLIFGKKPQPGSPSGWAYGVASESVALGFLGYEVVRDLEPGEVLFIDREGQVHSQTLQPRTGVTREARPCMFEWVYFASPESVIDGGAVYRTRIELGRQLARGIKPLLEQRGITADLVVPVPETSRIAAISLAEELDIPYREVLIKNRYIKRTFILDSQEKRQKAVDLKLSPVRSEIEGKRVLLVDDSIVRGTTSRKIISLVRRAGAKQVFFVSTCPMIQHPCYYGIDFPDESELIASGRKIESIEQELGADAVIYQDIPGLLEAIRSSSGGRFKPCMACLDGDYPTDVRASGRSFSKSRIADRRSTQRVV